MQNALKQIPFFVVALCSTVLIALAYIIFSNYPYDGFIVSPYEIMIVFATGDVIILLVLSFIDHFIKRNSILTFLYFFISRIALLYAFWNVSFEDRYTYFTPSITPQLLHHLLPLIAIVISLIFGCYQNYLTLPKKR